MLVKPASANNSPEGKRAAGPTTASPFPAALKGRPPAADDISGGPAAAGAEAAPRLNSPGEAAPTVYLNLARRGATPEGCEVGST